MCGSSDCGNNADQKSTSSKLSPVAEGRQYVGRIQADGEILLVNSAELHRRAVP